MVIILAVMKFPIQEAFLQTFSGSNFYRPHATYLKASYLIGNVKCNLVSDFKFSYEQNFRTKRHKVYTQCSLVAVE